MTKNINDSSDGIRAIGTAFSQNTLITSFNELNYFTNVKTTSEGAFYNCRNLKSVGLMNLTSAGHQVLRNSGIVYAWMPKITYAGTTASQAYRVWFYETRQMIAARLDSANTIRMFIYESSCKYLVCTMSTVPALIGTYVPPKIYVLDNLVTSYKEANNWSGKTILPLSQLSTDYPDCPWLDDLRQKGFIS